MTDSSGPNLAKAAASCCVLVVRMRAGIVVSLRTQSL